MWKSFCILAVVAGAVFIGGCERSGEAQTAATTPAATEVATQPRIVSMVPAATFNLVLIGGADRLVGVTKYDATFLPDEEKSLPIVGDYETMNLERLVDLHPTAVVVQMSAARLPEGLRSVAASHHIEIVNLKLDNVADMWAAVQELGRISGREKQADEMIDAGKKDLAAIGEEMKNKPRVKVAYIVGKDPLYVAGGKTFLDEMVRLAGGDNVGAKVGDFYPVVGKEMLADLQPEVLLVSAPDEPEQVGGDPRVESYLKLPVPAAKDKRVWLVTDGNSLIASVDLAKHVRKLAELLHRDEMPRLDFGGTPAGEGRKP